MLLNARMRDAFTAALILSGLGLPTRDAADNVAARFALTDLEIDLLAIRLDGEASRVAQRVYTGEGFAEPACASARDRAVLAGGAL